VGHQHLGPLVAFRRLWEPQMAGLNEYEFTLGVIMEETHVSFTADAVALGF
jgi:hypothetical protein